MNLANIIFKRGKNLSSSTEKVDGTLYFDTQEQTIYLDDSNNSRISIGNGKVYYGECDTAAAIAKKEINDIPGFKLIKGTILHVKFKNANSATSPTLNVNSTGDIPLYQYGTTAIATTAETTGWRAGATICLVYDGVGWIRNQGNNTNTNTLIRVYKESSGYDNNYPILVSRTLGSNIGAGSTAYTAVYGVLMENSPTVNPSSGLITANGLNLKRNSSQTDNTAIQFIGSKAASAIIQFLDNTNDSYGNGIAIGGGGISILGSGESAQNFITNVLGTTFSASSESALILADTTIYLEANANSIANRIGVSIDTSGNILPSKAEQANPGVQNLGSLSNSWHNLYLTAPGGSSTWAVGPFSGSIPIAEKFIYIEPDAFNGIRGGIKDNSNNEKVLWQISPVYGGRFGLMERSDQQMDGGEVWLNFVGTGTIASDGPYTENYRVQNYLGPACSLGNLVKSTESTYPAVQVDAALSGLGGTIILPSFNLFDGPSSLQCTSSDSPTTTITKILKQLSRDYSSKKFTRYIGSKTNGPAWFCDIFVYEFDAPKDSSDATTYTLPQYAMGTMTRFAGMYAFQVKEHNLTVYTIKEF